MAEMYWPSQDGYSGATGIYSSIGVGRLHIYESAIDPVNNKSIVKVVYEVMANDRAFRGASGSFTRQGTIEINGVTQTLSGSKSVASSTNAWTEVWVSDEWEIPHDADGSKTITIITDAGYSEGGPSVYLYGSSTKKHWVNAVGAASFTLKLSTFVNVSVQCANGISDPAGTFRYLLNDALTISAVSNENCSLQSMTVNGANVKPIEYNLYAENGIGLFHFDNDKTDAFGMSAVTNSISYNANIKKFGTHSAAVNNGVIAINLPASHQAGDITVECWFYPTVAVTSGKYQTLFSTNSTSSTAAGIYVQLDQAQYSRQPYFRCNTVGSTSGTGWTAGWEITRNAWHHFAYARHGNDHHFFIDGYLMTTITKADTYDITSVYFGNAKTASGYGTSYMNGYFDEVVITEGCKWTESFTPLEKPYSEKNIKQYEYTIPVIVGDTVISIKFVSESAGTPVYIGGVEYYCFIGNADGTWSAADPVIG